MAPEVEQLAMRALGEIRFKFHT